MKRLIMIILVLVMSCTVMFGCGKKGGEKHKGNEMTFVDLGEDFNKDYYPVADKITQYQGQVDVVILFEGDKDGWTAVADEYMKIQPGTVIKINDSYSSETYADKLNYEISNSNTDWDIIQGNLCAAGNLQTYGLNMTQYLSTTNAYSGNKTWKDVLNEDAYITDKTGSNTSTYILNSQGLQTAWFVNKTAVEAANVEAQKDSKTVSANPTTWDGLMELCKYMQKAGYTNPLGISLATSSIKADQFTWLLRIYGDWYYRNEYNKIMKSDEYEIDLTDENPESDKDYKIMPTKMYNLILEETSKDYVGATSDKFADFIEQFHKMKDYLQEDAQDSALTQMRSLFRYQTRGKESPQIILDYAGSGLAYLESDKIEMDFFDYPMMQSEFVDAKTLLRDVGGNGGYLSVVNHGKAQNDLNVDFLKFFMSPYGQSIYYNAMAKSGAAPIGLTNVKNDLVCIPQNWKTFFSTDKISFSGLSDNNPFVSSLIRYMQKDSKTIDDSLERWRNYLCKEEKTAYFQGKWADSLLDGWKRYCKTNGWNENCYKYPGQDVNYGG